MMIYRNLTNDLKLQYINNCNKEFAARIYKRPDAINTIQKIIAIADFFVINDDVEDFNNGGYIAFYSNNHKTEQAFISLLCVNESKQNTGLGTLLISDCVDYCRKKGMKEIKLEVRNNNNKAIKFYKKNGFICTEKASNGTVYMLKKI